MPPPVSAFRLFPAPPSITFAEDAKLKLGVAIAVDELKKARAGVTPPFRLAIIDLVGGSPLKWGAHEPDTMDFIASEAKIIALYAAFALRDMVRRFASSSTRSKSSWRQRQVPCLASLNRPSELAFSMR
jgi:hypothetical protein